MTPWQLRQWTKETHGYCAISTLNYSKRRNLAMFFETVTVSVEIYWKMVVYLPLVNLLRYVGGGLLCANKRCFGTPKLAFFGEKATGRSGKVALSCRKKAQKRATIRYPSAARKPTKIRVLNPQKSMYSTHHQRVHTPCINRQKCFCYVPIHSSTLCASTITPDSYINVKKELCRGRGEAMQNCRNIEFHEVNMLLRRNGCAKLKTFFNE